MDHVRIITSGHHRDFPLDLETIRKEMNEVAGEDQAPVVVDRLQFLNWVVSLNAILEKWSPN